MLTNFATWFRNLPTNQNDLKSLDFMINRFFIKFLRTSNIDTVYIQLYSPLLVKKSKSIKKQTNNKRMTKNQLN